MTKQTIHASAIKKGDTLIDADSGIECTVLETSQTEIAWFQPWPEGAAFGQCDRTNTPRIFKNVTA